MQPQRNVEQPGRHASWTRRLLLLLMVLTVFGGLATGETLFYSDFSLILHPSLEFWIDRVSAWTGPWWNPNQALGLPQLANPIVGTFYPGFLLLNITGAAQGLTILVVLHALIMAVGMSQWVLSMGGDNKSALFAGAGAICGAYVSTTAYGYMLFSWAWVPWILAFAVNEKPWLVSLTTALALLAGDPLAALTGSAVSWIISSRLRGMRSVLSLGLAAALAALISAVQLVPTWLFLPESVRSTGAIGSEGVWSLAPSRLFELWLPALFGRYAPEYSFWGKHLTDGLSDGNFFYYSVYTGLVPWLLLPGALRSPHRRVVLSLLAISICCVWIALGTYGGLYTWLLDVVPGVSLFRYPERWVLPATLAFLGASSLGLSSFKPRDALVLGAPICGLALLVLLMDATATEYIARVVVDDLQRVARAQQVKSALHTLVVLCCVGSLLLSQRIDSLRPWFLCAVLLVDLAVAHRSLLWTADVSILEAPAAVGKTLSEVARKPSPIVARDQRLDIQRNPKNLEGLQQIVQRNGLTLRGNAANIANVRTLHTESPARLNHAASPHAWFWFDPVRSAPILGVDFVFVSLDDPSPSLARELQKGTTFRWLNRAPNLGLGVLGPVHPPLGDIMCGQSVISVSGADAVLDALQQYDPRQHVILEVSDAPVEGSDRPEPLELTKHQVRTCGTRIPVDDPHIHLVDLDLEAPTAVVLRQAYSNGWRWTVDGEEVPSYRAYGSMTAAVIQKGRHRIVIQYDPPGLAEGIGLSIFGCLLFGIWGYRARTSAAKVVV